MDDVRGQAASGGFDPATLGIMPSAEVTEVHLLRHGEVVEFERREVRGQMDVELSDRGRQQNERLVGWFARVEPRPDHLFTSDLARCALLADTLGKVIDRAPRPDVRLREQSMGAWQGRTWEEITVEEPARVTAYWDDYFHTAPTDGESVQDLDRRVREWWASTLATCCGSRITVVTHVGVIRVLLCMMLRLPASEALRFAPPTASHTGILYSEAGAVLTSFGERPWLETGEATP